MKIIKNSLIKSKHQKQIVLDYFYIENNKPKAIVIFCHGYKGYKDWGAWNIMAKKFAEANLFFVKFNFSHNGGTVKNPIDFPDLEAFSNNNYTIELDDLETVISHLLKEKQFYNETDKTNIILIGHSRGGGIVALKASQNNNITAVVSYNGISDIAARFPKGEALEIWRKSGIGYVENSRTKQQMPNKYQLYENFLANKEKLNIKKAIKKIKIPHLIVQGLEDTVVLPIEGKNMHQWNEKSELLLVDGMNHSLGNTQPWLKETMPLHLENVSEHTLNFIKKHVNYEN